MLTHVHIYEEPNGLLVGDKRNLREYFNYAVFQAPNEREGERSYMIRDKIDLSYSNINQLVTACCRTDTDSACLDTTGDSLL